MIRLISPVSKHKSQELLEKRFGKQHSLDALYRSMDKLFPEINSIKQATFKSTKSLFPEGVNLILFDVTTLYLETSSSDELRNYGYSKDHRFNSSQVVLALATNEDGLPVGYELFEGNKAEVKTLVASIDHWNSLFDIGSVCFIGDRAMMSSKNIELLESRGYNYIIAAKIRKLPQQLQEMVLDGSNYKINVIGNAIAWIGEFEYNQQRLIVSYKQKRAIKDAKDRQTIIDKIKKRLGKCTNTDRLITNSGVKKYTISTGSKTEISEDKIAQDSLWDGLHGVITNIKPDPKNDNSKAPAIISKYANLWKIEESFRINKHTLKMRPIFHWKPDRIHSHIAICYMTFSVLRHLQYRVNLTQKISVDRIIETLNDVQASIYRHKRTGDRYRVPGFFSNNARKIYKTFDIPRSLDAQIYFPH